MLSNIQVGSVNTGQNVVVTAPEASKKNLTLQLKKRKKRKSKERGEKGRKEVEKCDKEKKSLCKGSGGMQLGGTKMKLKKPKKN